MPHLLTGHNNVGLCGPTKLQHSITTRDGVSLYKQVDNRSCNKHLFLATPSLCKKQSKETSSNSFDSMVANLHPLFIQQGINGHAYHQQMKWRELLLYDLKETQSWWTRFNN